MLRIWQHLNIPPKSRPMEPLVSPMFSHTDRLFAQNGTQWPLEDTGDYANLQSVCHYVAHIVMRSKADTAGIEWPVAKLSEALRHEMFPALGFVKELEGLLPIDPGDIDANAIFTARFCLGSYGLGPVIYLFQDLGQLLGNAPGCFTRAERHGLIVMVNPYARALRRLMEHLRNTCDRSYYDPRELATLRALLQDEGHRLGVSP